MEITLRGKQYKAEHLTDLNYLALGNLFIDEKTGNFALEAVENYDLLSQSDRLRLSGPLMKKLTDPKEKGAIACSLSAIFPSLPKELVSYANGEFTLNITLEELTRITLEVANELSKGKAPVADAEAIAIAELEKELAQRKAAKGFAKL
ncbi:hypothetical protein [Aulosira sp. FACHB-615]|uniref:hypothetical protein n=1 Tax=Aulosira sp. FACHB-615 TaxID=2692777 RepID=UPI0016892354|nr:hypothetical protein [Aulosira sp. FACHB-615]MBD2492528.1 hypothetical protein [Aulosira sp. FACHB-615]